MTDVESNALFAEMTRLVAAMTADPDHPSWSHPSIRELPGDEPIIFARLAKRMHPELSDEDRRQLFPQWEDYERRRLRVELIKARAELGAADDERQKPFGHREGACSLRCACGVILDDASDPETIRQHKPHMIAAGVLRDD
ncbi:hypothetical protein [Bradyrhizobium centrosematis]|uniref:hypothetical protein n=1 Tax=Bradyrhizobium centrosematis TaxID=1300039 RepID=UPI00388D6863